MDFGPPANFRGHARDSLKIKKNNWVCLTAQDQLHTLRSSADVECVGTTWVAVWKGDPLLDGNWLVGGNLDGYKKEDSNPDVIDVLDFGKFIFETARGASYATGDTSCADVANGPHGDINGDGAVDNLDYAIIQNNFLASSKNACCPDASAAVPTPIMSISVKELRMMGLGELAVADLNSDGMLDMADMDAYQAGAAVQTVVPGRKRGGTRGTR